VDVGLKNSALLNLVCIYLVGIPVISSLNGLSMHLAGVSAIGPIYHTAFSLAIIGLALLSPSVEKSFPAVFAAVAFTVLMIGTQCALGLSDFALLDLGTLYKWLMPILLLAVFCRWRYLAQSEAKQKLEQVFRDIPLVYSGLIFLSLATYLAFGFNPTVFGESAKMRFVGYAWGYNATVNTFFICGYLNLLLLKTPTWMKIVYGLAFILLLSKTAVAYFALLGVSLVRPYVLRRSFRARSLLLLAAAPVMAAAGWFGYIQTLRSADLYGGASQSDATTLETVVGALTNTRLDWWQYVIEDAADWPALNVVIGNGTNIDRRLETSLWWNQIGRRFYRDLHVGKQNKTLELDMLGHFDLFGGVGMLVFAGLFYVYPMLRIKLPFFRPYLLFLVVLSLFGGHVVNNSHTTPIFVFLLLFTRNHNPARSRAVPPTAVRPHPAAA
jgi:hypothetical protein